jgi:hypothetical protein
MHHFIEEQAMILGSIGTAALLAIATAAQAQTSSSNVTQPGASGSAEMGRGRCEALIGAEREKCLADERTNAATGTSSAEVGRGRCEGLTGAEREKCQTEERASGAAAPATQRSDERK